MKQYIVDAFTDRVFSGNPAAVCLLEEAISDELMKNIAMENNLSETAYILKEGNTFNLRWFTPGGEIDLCGHATLASAFVLFEKEGYTGQSITFSTLSGDLTVEKKKDLFEMAFPAYDLKEVPVTNAMEEALGARPLEAYLARDLVCIFDDESIVKELKPKLDKIKDLEGLLVHPTAPGVDFDCVSRSFAPKLSVDEDPVCGSGHCHIVPYWAKRLGKDKIEAFQASPRGGRLSCRLEGERVYLAGKAVLFSEGNLDL